MRARTGEERGGGPDVTPGPGESCNLISSLVTSGSCGLCAYVDEADTPLQQFFRGLREVDGREKDTASHVMKLGQAPSAWVLGGGLGTDETRFDVERDVGVPIREELHDVYWETSIENAGRRLSSLFKEDTPGGSRTGDLSSQKDVIFVLLAGDLCVAERLLSEVNSESLDEAFVALVVERPGYDISEIVNGNASCSFRPPQSFTFRGSRPITLRNDIVSTVVYRGPRSPPPLTNVVTRVDGVTRLDNVRDVYTEGCGKCILAERVLFEVSYKIGRSEKFGS